MMDFCATCTNVIRKRFAFCKFLIRLIENFLSMERESQLSYEGMPSKVSKFNFIRSD